MSRHLRTIVIVRSRVDEPTDPVGAAPRRRGFVSPRLYRIVTVAALVALVAIVVTGATVRLTGSGLGCTDWPQCEEGQFFAEVDNVHAMAEFLNRLFTGVVSVAVMLAVLGSLVRVPRRRDLTWLSLGLVAGVIAQIVWGGFTVLTELRPEMVMGHYLISAVLVANAAVLVQRAATGGAPLRPAVAPATLGWSRALVAVTAVVLVAGAIVTNTGPHAGDENAVRFGFDISTVARIHAVTVWVLLAVAIVTLRHAYRDTAGTTDGKRVRRRGRLLVLAIVVQAAIGYVQYATGVPATLVGLHVFGSILVLLAVIGVHLALVVRPPLEVAGSKAPAPADEPTDAPTAGAAAGGRVS
jgi:heme a synthase